jgi:hypothetical protein
METYGLKAKTREQVSGEYNTTVRTLIRRLKRKGVILEPGLIFPNTLKIIYDTLGRPEKV